MRAGPTQGRGFFNTKFLRVWVMLAVPLAVCLFVVSLATVQPAAAKTSVNTVRLGVVAFGTVAWEVEAIRTNGLDRAADLDLQTVTLANAEAGKIALLGGAVDLIVSDWFWVARQRTQGNDPVFLPYSRSVGALVVPADSAVRSPADLRGRRLGVAGGPLDKNWLLLRALLLRDAGFDPATETTVHFASPPLLNEEMAAGRLDAVLTFWNFAARAEAAGARRVIAVSDILARLGLGSDVPALGYVARGEWATANAGLLQRFFATSQRAKALLLRDDAAWTTVRPLMRAANEAEFLALREGYRAGVPVAWGAPERAAAADLYALLARLGGEALVGPQGRLDPGTFWPHAVIAPQPDGGPDSRAKP